MSKTEGNPLGELRDALKDSSPPVLLTRDPMCPLEPMPGKIIVKPETEDSNITRYRSGLYKVDMSGENRPISAPIVAIGDDTDNDDVGFRFHLGDQVIFSRHAGVVVSFGDRGEIKYIILKASEILARSVETK